ncbi:MULTISPECIES: sensor histidine kinase [unclassified Streptomyces]|uniref:sensor histidine kinase n=1 Tax=unclassified Streptomyces TaxID=2593676 RepID=UPI002E814B82|nr:sensor histidine kinase [Streptomyces sp. NBC_00589]WTI34099.1 sensor histidine kinase [Streptomyces sp. NBC_00775]WUB32228.1 sensor histidine kinase [Streptomyces sp. NBC_00589]
MSIDDTAHRTALSEPPFAEADLPWNHPLARRLSRLGRRLKQGDRNHPWILDAGVIAVVALMFCVPDLVHDGNRDRRGFDLQLTHLPWPGTVALQAGLVLPLLWRRRRPSLAFAVIAVVFFVQLALGVWLRADVALLIALYSLVLHGQLRRLPVACAVVAAALGLAAVRLAPEVHVLDALFFLFSTIIAAVALGLAVRIRRAQLAVLRDRATRLEIERDQRSKLAAAAERTRVAREMHDIVGHNLSVIITLADGGAYASDHSPERGKQALLLIGDTGRQALGELRRMLGVLREQTQTPTAPQLSPQPGIEDIDALCARIRAAGPQVVYRTGGELDTLDRGVQLTVYRIAQEALTNALKHAGHDTRVELAVSVKDTRLHIDVHDTGRGGGTVRPGPPQEEGHGLAGMRERAALYNGTVTAGPAPGGGWTVRATLDLTPLAGTDLTPPAATGGAV